MLYIFRLEIKFYIIFCWYMVIVVLNKVEFFGGIKRWWMLGFFGWVLGIVLYLLYLGSFENVGVILEFIVN